MTLNEYQFEEQIRKLLGTAKAELAQNETEQKSLQSKAVLLTSEIGALEIVLEGFLRRSGRPVDTDSNWLKQLKAASTHKDRIMMIAKRENGVLKTNQITDMMYSTGCIQSKSRVNAYQIVNRALVELEEDKVIEKVGPGEYRVVGAQQVFQVPITNVQNQG